MELIINGEARQVDAVTVQQLVSGYGLDNKLVIVELNGHIVDREDWPATGLQEGMKVELVHFVGGG